MRLVGGQAERGDPAGERWIKRWGMCMASDRVWRLPADMQPIELTRARIPRFISSHAGWRGKEVTEKDGGERRKTEEEHIIFQSIWRDLVVKICVQSLSNAISCICGKSTPRQIIIILQVTTLQHPLHDMGTFLANCFCLFPHTLPKSSSFDDQSCYSHTQPAQW